MRHKLHELHERTDSSDTEPALRQRLKQVCRQRFFKVWHDHATIAGHGHFLVLMSCIYDSAFYYTSDEMKALKGIDIDVPTLVESPEIHILGRSGSSLDNQAEFNTIRKQCLQDLSVSLKTTSGVPVQDICRFFGQLHSLKLDTTSGGNTAVQGVVLNLAALMISPIAFAAPNRHLLKDKSLF